MPIPTLLQTDSGRLDADRFWLILRIALYLGFGFALFVLVWAIRPLGVWVVVFPVMALGVAAYSVLARNEVVILCVIIAAFAAVARYEPGFQPEEVLYGLLSLGYLGWWFASRLFLYRDSFIRTRVDWALVTFLVWVTASVGITILLHGSMTRFASEWLSVIMLGYYFPIKEAVRRHNGGAAILGSAGFVTVFIAVRNLLEYRNELSSAEMIWQIATGRVVQNEHLLMMAGLFVLVLLLYTRRTSMRLLLLAGLVMFTAGVIVGLSRALWVSYALGGVVVFLLADRQRRLLMLGVGSGGMVAVVVVAMIVFPTFFEVIVAGLLDRLFSLGEAVTQDVSLINRFVETGAAWDYILRNPILGYGFGVPYQYYSLVYELSYETTFVHNGYIGVWYRHGLVGFVLLMYFFFSTLWGGIRLSRSRLTLHVVIGISAAASFTATTLLTTVANPFTTSEKTFFFAVIAALVAGSLERERAARGVELPPSKDGGI